MSDSIIHCIVDIFVKPECIEKVRPLLFKLVEYSIEEDGCLHYELCENINDKFQFTFIEIWTNDEAFENHLQSDHIQKVSVDLYHDFTKAADIKRYKPLQTNLKKMNNTKTTSTNSHLCVLI